MGQTLGKEERRIGITDHRPSPKKPNGSTEPFPLETLPRAIQRIIMLKALGRLPPKDRLRLSLLGPAWRSATLDSIKQIYMRDFSEQVQSNVVVAPSCPTERRKAFDAFFGLLPRLSKTLDTLAIPPGVFTYGLHSNKWASLPAMANVKTVHICAEGLLQ